MRRRMQPRQTPIKLAMQMVMQLAMAAAKVQSGVTRMHLGLSGTTDSAYWQNPTAGTAQSRELFRRVKRLGLARASPHEP